LAKDGTNRGGARAGAGRKPKALKDKIDEGKSASVIAFDNIPDFVGTDIPPPGDYLSAAQKDGKELGAVDLYIKTWKWLTERGCEKLISPQLVEHYAMACCRFIQCQNAISEYGFLAKHPTTGAAISSPYVSMAKDFEKQASAAWFQIFQVVKENCSGDYAGASAFDPMEQLLNSRKDS